VRGYFDQRYAVIYMQRNLEDTVRSIYELRSRFGLDEDDFEQFKRRRICDMYSKDIPVDVIRDTLTLYQRIRHVDGLLQSRSETVPEYINTHIASWMAHEGRRGFLGLKYEDLVNDFRGTMLGVAGLLGSNRTEFVDEPQRVGWRDPRDNANWRKPPILTPLPFKWRA
jgi:hypothetical protein